MDHMRRGTLRLDTVKMAVLDEARSLARSLSVTPNEALQAGIRINQDGVRRTGIDLLALPLAATPAAQWAVTSSPTG